MRKLRPLDHPIPSEGFDYKKESKAYLQHHAAELTRLVNKMEKVFAEHRAACLALAKAAEETDFTKKPHELAELTHKIRDSLKPITLDKLDLDLSRCWGKIDDLSRAVWGDVTYCPHFGRAQYPDEYQKMIEGWYKERYPKLYPTDKQEQSPPSQ